MTIYTIGHSTHNISSFMRIANKRFDTLIDIRSHPHSTWPQWHINKIHEWAPKVGLKYMWWPSLGGWNIANKHLVNPMFDHGVDIRPYMGEKFPKQRIAQTVGETQEPMWTNTGLRDFSYYMTTRDFLKGAEGLMDLDGDVAIMCAEAHWWRCHRSMVSDYLWYRSVDSQHIMSAGAAKSHRSVIGDRLERYEPFVLETWENYDA